MRRGKKLKGNIGRSGFLSKFLVITAGGVEFDGWF